ncbi:MAG: hypothetical protein ACKPKO_54865, partial [Candidatus Fonsibacter sp.]
MSEQDEKFQYGDRVQLTDNKGR